VDTLRELVEREAGRVAIDLKEVTLVDGEAVRLLALSETNGIELRNCPAYVRDGLPGRGLALRRKPQTREQEQEMTSTIFDLNRCGRNTRTRLDERLRSAACHLGR